MEKITIYSLPGCSACTNAKKLAETNNIEVEYLSMADVSPKFFMDALGHIPRTVPQIFDGAGEYIGGFSDLQTLLANA